MLHRTNTQKNILQKINLSLVVGVMLWVILLARGAQTLRNTPLNHEYLVRFGPLVLNRVNKQPVEGGFSAGFSFGTGFLWYLLIWLLVGLLVGVIFSYFKKYSGGDNEL